MGIMNYYNISGSPWMSLILLVTVTVLVVGTILEHSVPSDHPSRPSSITFVTAAWASSSGWNHPYRTTTPAQSSSITLPTAFHRYPPKDCRDHHNSIVSSQQYRGGNQDRNSYNTGLSMVDTTTSDTSTEDMVNLIQSSGLSMENYDLLSDRGKVAIRNLIRYDHEYQDQIHIYQNWPPVGTDDDNKIRLSEQVH